MRFTGLYRREEIHRLEGELEAVKTERDEVPRLFTR